MQVTRKEMTELQAIGAELFKKGYDESDLEEYCDIQEYIEEGSYTERGYYIYLGWTEAREDFIELDKFLTTYRWDD